MSAGPLKVITGGSDLVFEREKYLGERGVPADHDFVDFIGVAGLTLRDCLFGSRDRDLLTLSGCRDVLVENCLFKNWGGALPDDPGQGHYAGGMAVFCMTPSYDGRIVGCRFYNGAGGIWLPVTNTFDPASVPGTGWLVSGNRFRGICEAAIVGGDGATISHNFIEDVARVDVSGHAMELHGDGLIVTHNQIRGCDGTGIFAGNLYNSVISGNIISNIGRKGPTGSIILSTVPASAGQGVDPPHHVTITDNELGKDGYILLTNGTGDPKRLMTDITIRSRAPVVFYPSRKEVVGANFDYVPSTGSKVLRAASPAPPA